MEIKRDTIGNFLDQKNLTICVQTVPIFRAQLDMISYW